MKVKVLRPFDDIEKKVARVKGEVFECTEARFKAINSTEFGTLVEKVEPAKKAAK